MSAATDRPMRLGLFLQGAGHHVAGWRHPEAQFGGENLKLIQGIARTAEEGHFDLLFLADGLTSSADAHPSFVARIEPIALLSALAMGTKHLGLAATMSTTYTEPFHIARAFASLDHLSGGRAAWNAVTTSYARSSANFSRGDHPSHDDRYAIAEECIDVVRGLWDSFADDAFVKDKARGVYVEPDRVHTLNHEGRYFSVKGPLNASRPPQGHPIIIQAGSSLPGQRLAARTSEIVFTAQQTLVEGKAFRDGLRGFAVEAGRNPDHVMVLPGVCPVIGGTEAEAKALYAQLQGGIDPAAAILLLNDRLGHDVSGYDLDGPLPNLPESDQLQSRARLLTDLARRENLTLRELYYLVAGARGHRIVWGTPEQVADALEEWFVGGGSDGFNIMPPFFPTQFERFVGDVVPILRKRGLVRGEYVGNTLRENLGLPRPANQFFPD
ncbi:LLM class flavin-dependent oxidoreductase [Roseomonas terrae]|jgi:FMN-dependent oxidoreductase (nitrilotriacetate monooxygenase family)|uniref:LLM class flavin-dependent oxidoreductase n=1 Tax=Neoroseomonas terrae TaxID=424799 RepID=A0ABS5EFU8_9PROT|nr:LLM class flavin-dependent oxidoreductase [Neoroseomonas terrae]MBR0649903.1 LLM class flavin-dependent oxidoreductase [Neoroseomonas terrae]